MNGAVGRPAPASTAVHPSSERTTVAASRWTRLAREFAIHDWFVLSYLTVLTTAVAVQPSSEARAACLARTGGMLLFSIVGIVTFRAGLLREGFLPPILYRVAVYGMVQLSYFELRELLPLVNQSSLDRQLSDIDEHILHFEPSITLDQFVTPATTEWFSFFYFGYFALLASHVLPLVFYSRHRTRLPEFALGMILVYATAHMLYMVVPGYGPFRYLAAEYAHQLPRGTWLDAVHNAVNSGGAQKDIFPSLHTAGPVFLSLFSFRRRGEYPFKYTWPFVAFFSLNIVIATLFLRWHYLIDVLAGLLLAFTASAVAARVSQRETERRERLGLGPVWTPIPWQRLARTRDSAP
jgi:membrane-associated phospholipid phosphatase